MKKPAPTRADARFQGDKDDYGARSIRNHLSDGTITDEDARLIIAFSSDLIASTGCSPGRSNKLISLLCNWRRWIPPYTEASDADLLTAAAAIRGACTHKGARYTPNARSVLYYKSYVYRYLAIININRKIYIVSVTHCLSWEHPR